MTNGSTGYSREFWWNSIFLKGDFDMLKGAMVT
jgi:hypothetical protein